MHYRTEQSTSSLRLKQRHLGYLTCNVFFRGDVTPVAYDQPIVYTIQKTPCLFFARRFLVCFVCEYGFVCVLVCFHSRLYVFEDGTQNVVVCTGRVGNKFSVWLTYRYFYALNITMDVLIAVRSSGRYQLELRLLEHCERNSIVIPTCLNIMHYC